jgi:hypothetical protein
LKLSAEKYNNNSWINSRKFSTFSAMTLSYCDVGDNCSNGTVNVQSMAPTMTVTQAVSDGIGGYDISGTISGLWPNGETSANFPASYPCDCWGGGFAATVSGDFGTTVVCGNPEYTTVTINSLMFQGEILNLPEGVMNENQGFLSINGVYIIYSPSYYSSNECFTSANSSDYMWPCCTATVVNQ